MAPNPFPHLLILLDDPSPVVQEEVRKALLPMAPHIQEYVALYQPGADQRLLLNKALQGWRKSQLLKAWPAWQQATGQTALETAHSLLSAYACGWTYPRSLSEELDLLAEKLRPELAAQPGHRSLCQLLFGERFKGERENYYAPSNSFLLEVLHSGRGNPISLSSLLVLVGRRLGLAFCGVSYPGHFLASFEEEGQRYYVDAFAGGQVLGVDLTPELRGERSLGQVRAALEQPCDAESIVERVLRNLTAACGNSPDGQLFGLLLKDADARSRGLGDGQPLRQPLFSPGQIVRHRTKDFRGVVVDYELYVDEGGPVHQPLYRILVHGSPHVAATREEQLMEADGLVAHPYLNVFFSHFEDGVYVRNQTPWQG